MKNVTITLAEDVARWARIRAARTGTSVSRMLGEYLERLLREDEGYDAAMERYLAASPRPLKRSGAYPRREKIHDRKGVRRHESPRLRSR